jgi:Uncharacterized protein conserved in bacteria (DUF2130)
LTFRGFATGDAGQRGLCHPESASVAKKRVARAERCVYRYLTGPRFRHRIEAVVERFTEMQADIDRERKAMTRLWAKRVSAPGARRHTSAGP